MTEGAVTFAVKSEVQLGRRVTATLLFEAKTDPEPLHGAEATLVPPPPQQPGGIYRPFVAEAGGLAGLSREVKWSGRLWSDGFQGGSVIGQFTVEEIRSLVPPEYRSLIQFVNHGIHGVVSDFDSVLTEYLCTYDTEARKETCNTPV